VVNYVDNIRIQANNANFSANPPEVTTKQASTSTLQLDAGASLAGRDYVIFTGVTGTWPGFTKGGHHVPLNIDPWTMTAFTLYSLPAFDNFMGTLDGNGQATATFNTLMPLPDAVGLVMYFAYLVYKPVDLASHHVYVLFLP
jgi:hypothetical protein